jgi:hypothetical protein
VKKFWDPGSKGKIGGAAPRRSSGQRKLLRILGHPKNIPIAALREKSADRIQTFFAYRHRK